VSMWAGPPRFDGVCDVDDYAVGLARFATGATFAFEISWAGNSTQDNYIELLPGESREITAQFVDSDALRDGAKLRVAGWNIQNVIVPIQRPAPDSPLGENQ